MDLVNLLPSPDLHLENIRMDTATHSYILTVTSLKPLAACPDCQQPASRVHSRYRRTLLDLPWANRAVYLQLQVRKFFCSNPTCSRRIFTERLPDLVAPSARQTLRLARQQRAVGQALGGAAGARLSSLIDRPISRMTLLRLVRRAPTPTPPTPRVLGVDDWAVRKGQRYATILVDLERRRPIALLPDREAETLAAWLREHPGVSIIARDRSSTYAEGAQRGAPDAIQVADRWHLLKNLADVLLEVLQQYRAPIAQLFTPPATPASGASHLPSAEQPHQPHPITMLTPLPPQPTPPHLVQRQQQVDQRRQARYERIQALFQIGWTKRAIAETLGIDRQTVYRYLKVGSASELQVRAPRRSILDPYKPYLLERWNAGCYNALQLFREIEAMGFGGKDATVRRYITQVRKAAGLPRFSRTSTDATGVSDPQAGMPSLRTLCWQILRRPRSEPCDTDREAQQIVMRLREAHADLSSAIGLAQEFAAMVRTRDAAVFDDWLDRARASGLSTFQRFAANLEGDEAAVRAALSLPWSTGPVEGHINRLKLLKRQMFGQASLDLLQHRLLAA